MGCGMSVEEKEGKQRNEEIENQLRKDRMSQRNEIKMLLLGMRDRYHLSYRIKGRKTADKGRLQVPANPANRPYSSR